MIINLKNIYSKLFVVSLIWLLLEGVFRKWLLPSLTVQLFVVKYALFGLTYLTFFIYAPQLPKTKKPFQFIMTIFIIYCAFQFFNTYLNPPFLVTAFGYINFLFFIPLLLVVPTYFNSIEKIEKFIKYLAWLSIPIFILGAIQYFLPDDHFLNAFANDEQKIARVSTFTRSISVFTFVKIYNVYLLASITIFYTYIFYRLKHNKKSSLYIFLVIFGILNMFMTGSRLPTILLLINISFVSFFIFLKINRLRKTIFIYFILGNVLLFLLYNFNNSFNSAIGAFINRVEFIEEVADKGVEGYSAKERTINRLDAFNYADEAGWFGFGIGTTYQGTGFFLSTKRPEIKYEEEGERIVLELGILGGIIVLLLRIGLLLYAVKTLLSIKQINYALLIIPFVLLIAPPVIFFNETTFNYFDNFVYWLAIGLIFSLKNIYTTSANQ